MCAVDASQVSSSKRMWTDMNDKMAQIEAQAHRRSRWCCNKLRWWSRSVDPSARVIMIRAIAWRLIGSVLALCSCLGRPGLTRMQIRMPCIALLHPVLV